MIYVAAVDCDVAQKYLSEVSEDPMTEHYGMSGEITEGYLREHVKKCELCRDATTEANMP